MRLIIDALLDLRAHRIRSALGAVGLLVAVLSLVAVTVTATVVREAFVARDEQLNGRMWTMAATMDYGLLTTGRLAEIGTVLQHRITATGGQYALMSEAPGTAAAVLPERRLGETAKVQMVLVTSGLPGVRRLPVLSGSWLPADEQTLPGGVVVNERASALLGEVGTRLRLLMSESVLPVDRQIVGVVSDGRVEPRVYQSIRSVLHSVPAMASLDGGLKAQLLVHYPQASPDDIRRKVTEVAAALRVAASTLEIRPVSGLNDYLASLEQTQLAFAAVAGVTLLVAIIGLLNIGLATLRERTRELSLRRALGATRSRIFGLVLSTTLILCGLVALIAVGIAYLGVQLVLPQILDPASAIEIHGFPWDSALYGGLAALVAGFAGGVFPALAAARVDVSQVLRD